MGYSEYLGCGQRGDEIGGACETLDVVRADLALKTAKVRRAVLNRRPSSDIPQNPAAVGAVWLGLKSVGALSV
jgi:hypothetical protein